MATKEIERSPVVVVMGHIDHGKSQLLDYIRKSNIVEKETGGITQHISAYEADVKGKKITFLDTPGHEAFSKMRLRGAKLADIAILVVSAEEGVKDQTIEVLKSIKESKIPFVVAISKIDKEAANVEKVKSGLIENEVYLEGMGGDIPYTPISSTTGKGIPELLEMILLVAELEELKGDQSLNAEGFVIETHLDQKRGVSATLVIKNGTLKNGMFVLSGTSCAPTRIMEDFLGKPIKEASFSSPINIVGWDKMPKVGEAFTSYGKKKELEKILKDIKEEKVIPVVEEEDERKVVPLIIKADTLGSIEAIQGEIEKIKDERISIKIIDNGTGNISENDIKVAGGSKETIVLGFNVKTDRGVENLADRMDVEIQTFGIIYKLTEWLNEEVKKRRPKIKDDEVRGKAKILKIFSKTKNKQVLGGEVKEGMIGLNDKVKILRRDEQIGEGVIVELQVAKTSAKEVREGTQFGAKIQSSVEIAERDKIEAFVTVEK